LDSRELIEETVRLALESVGKGWGGPFGAVVVKDGEIVARGQNRVLLTGDPTAHAEMEAIRNAVRILGPGAPDAPAPERPRMLTGCELYATGEPCPMCMGAVSWARLERVYYSCDIQAAEAIGFDDRLVYEELAKPGDERLVPMRQIFPELGERAYRAWSEKPDRRPY
jgi:guanine deaminase